MAINATDIGGQLTADELERLFARVMVEFDQPFQVTYVATLAGGKKQVEIRLAKSGVTKMVVV